MLLCKVMPIKNWILKILNHYWYGWGSRKAHTMCACVFLHVRVCVLDINFNLCSWNGLFYLGATTWWFSDTIIFSRYICTDIDTRELISITIDDSFLAWCYGFFVMLNKGRCFIGGDAIAILGRTHVWWKVICIYDDDMILIPVLFAISFKRLQSGAVIALYCGITLIRICTYQDKPYLAPSGELWGC